MKKATSSGHYNELLLRWIYNLESQNVENFKKTMENETISPNH